MSGPRPLALVTGGARRVGRAIALELARRGCDVTITYRESAAEAEQTRLRIESVAPGSRARALRCDLASAAEVEALAATMGREAGLSVLVHNASTYLPSPLAGLEGPRLAADYHVNALAPALLSARLAEALGRSAVPGGGAIVAMADLHALAEHGLPRPGYLSYAMSKAALLEMTRSLARELAPRVRVNAVAPGVVAWPEEGPEAGADARAQYLRRVPLGRAGTPEEAARLVAFLALDATYMTGQVVRLDGGRSLR
ncbi:MAG TPA: SDR family oxidoreductase [Phycisphaerales bacterium]|nr:SDR family oxidoreductase [Phycisphaerales bacterium]